VFKMFKRLHSRDAYGGGTGAGLTIVKKLVERHHGQVWLDSALGVGTTFFFTLPCEEGRR
jgi:two-component system, chemotaxis family, sensor kinase Cph1